MTLNIVLVEPQIPQNTGNIARTCAATNARLHLVGPMGFQIDDNKLKRAGLDYWHMLDITYYDNIADFFAKTIAAPATTTTAATAPAAYHTPSATAADTLPSSAGAANATSAMATTPGQTAPTAFPDTAGPPAPAEYPDTSGLPFYYFTTKARHIYTKPRYENNSYIIFGSEPKGLDETLLRRNTDQCVRLPMRPGARSLNLSNTVAVAVFEVLRQWDFPELQLTSRDLATSPTPR